jgi:L-alanine-DL-glutamate epimerase-like enolase superfamily enzyme
MMWHSHTHGQVEAVLHHLEIPLLRPFNTATGSVSTRSVGLVSTSRSGQTGWGEASPYPGQDESFDDVLDAARVGAMTPTLTAALDEAICDLVAREQGVSLSSELGRFHTTVPVSIALGVGEDAITTAEEAWQSGVTRFKIKIMPDRTSHVAEIRHWFPDATLGVDANGSFDASTVGEILALAGLGLSFVEQPSAAASDPAVQTLAGAGFVVFVDESIRSPETADRALGTPGVAGIVIKPGRLGWRGSIEIVQMARDAGKLWRASGLLETGVGRAYSLALACASDAFVSDIAQASRFFSYDVTSPGTMNSELVVPAGPGSGVDVDIDVVHNRALEVIPLSESAARDIG